MRLSVTLEHRFHQTPDGRLWSQTMFPYEFWKRYLEVFDHVNIIARALPVKVVDSGWKRVDGDGVSYTPVPYYVGPMQYLLRALAVSRSVRNGVGPRDAVILRVGSWLAVCLEPRLRREGRPFAVEVVNDPHDTFAPGSVRHPMRPFFRWLAPRNLRRLCKTACAAAYVTEKALQRRYPPGDRAFATYYSDVNLSERNLRRPAAAPLPPYTTYYSSIELAKTDLSTSERIFEESREKTKLINVGTMAQMYKAQDVLIDAVALCVREGMNLELILVGDGRHRRKLESRALKGGLGRRVTFLGQLPAGNAVLSALDNADIFVLPSHQEGLPRAMIEAMARGLPCIGSNVGGLPELLPPEDMVAPGDVQALAIKIRDVANNSARMNRMSARNLDKAGEYREDVLAERRRRFYREVRERTAQWVKARGALATSGKGGYL